MRRGFLYSLLRGCCAVVFLFFTAALLIEYPEIRAEGVTVLKGRVTDADGRAVEGAMIFLYAGQGVRRSADFISAGSNKDGLFRMVLVPGKYRAVARLKKVDGFGPLMPGDRHSGEPREIDIVAETETVMDFIVMDLKDAIKKHSKDREGAVKISGRIIDESGAPVPDTYAIANRNEKGRPLPDFMSAWVDSEGRFTMFLPKGRYYIGSSAIFPPGDDYVTDRELTVTSEKSDLEIIRKSRKDR